MKTLNSPNSHLCKLTLFGLAVSFFLSTPLHVYAQNKQGDTPQSEEATEPASQRPKETDKASLQLIKNYLAVTGGEEAHEAMQNIVATGTIKEAGKIKSFELIETSEGKRRLTYKWKHLGRHYENIYAFDGTTVWKQEILPKKLPTEPYTGPQANHFVHQRWLIHPFTPPLETSYVFKYQGTARAGGRQAHLVVGYGPKNERTWFYFDKEKFLVTRHGGLSTIAGVKEYFDYRATRFKYVDGVLLPMELDLLVENASFGKITFDTIQLNEDVDPGIFTRPPDTLPLLRQRPVATNP